MKISRQIDSVLHYLAYEWYIFDNFFTYTFSANSGHFRTWHLQNQVLTSSAVTQTATHAIFPFGHLEIGDWKFFFRNQKKLKWRIKRNWISQAVTPFELRLRHAKLCVGHACLTPTCLLLPAPSLLSSKLYLPSHASATDCWRSRGCSNAMSHWRRNRLENFSLESLYQAT